VNYINNINFKEKELFDDLKTIKAEKAKYNNYIEYYNNCYIINSEIMNLIKSIINKNKIGIIKKTIFVKNNLIYILYTKNIVIGDLNEKLIFNPKYILSYKNSDQLNVTKKTLFSCKSDNYFKKLINNENGQLINLEKQKDNKNLNISKSSRNVKMIKNHLSRLNSEEYNIINKDTRFDTKESDQSPPHYNKCSNINHNNLQKEIENLTKKIAQYENIINEQKQKNLKINELNKIIKEKDNQIIKLNESIKKYEEYINKIKDNNNLLTKELNVKEKELNELIKINKEYQLKIDKIKGYKKSIKTYKTEKEKEINDLKNKYELIVKENELKDNENNSNKKKLINIDKINKKLINKNKKLKEINMIKDNEIQNLKNNIENKENEIKELKINNNQFMDNIQILKQKNNQLISEINNYKNRENILLKKEKAINKKISFLEDKENLIEKENNEIRMKKEKLKNNLENNIKNKQGYNYLIEKNKKLEKQIKKEELKVNKIKKTKIKKKSPLTLYNEPTLIGLNNIGATCFMNSTLQCLSQTKSLTNYFLNEKNKDKIMNNNIALKNKNNYQLSPIYLELIQKLWDKNGNKSFSPNNFMNVIEIMNPLFKKGQAGDSKDFIIFILEQLHKELKSSIKNNINNIEQQPLNQYNKNNAFNHFFGEFQKECSIISDIFFGFNETTNECINCKNKYNSRGLNNPICYNYGIFNCLIFPLEEVKKLKNTSFQINNIQISNNRVSLDECFFYNQKTDYFTGDDKNFCNVCKQLYDSMYTNKIFIGPNVLVLILNRGKDNVYNVKIDFYENIDITQFVLQKDKPRITYNLYGVITHIGKSGPNAHFVASCKSPINNRWYRYNDAIVNEITNIQKDVIEFGTPYILFYQRN